MLINVDTSDSRPIYVQIMDEIRRSVVLGTVKADDPLPSVRQLATELKVNPNTVQQAYRELEREGLAYVARGKGTFVSPKAVEESARERRALAREVAERAVRDAYRHGLSPGDLVEAVESLSEERAADLRLEATGSGGAA